MKWRKALSVICDRKLPFELEGKFSCTIIKPALFYKFNVVEMRILCWMSNHTKTDKIRNECIREKVGLAPIIEKLVEICLR